MVRFTMSKRVISLIGRIGSSVYRSEFLGGGGFCSTHHCGTSLSSGCSAFQHARRAARSSSSERRDFTLWSAIANIPCSLLRSRSSSSSATASLISPGVGRNLGRVLMILLTANSIRSGERSDSASVNKTISRCENSWRKINSISERAIAVALNRELYSMTAAMFRHVRIWR